MESDTMVQKINKTNLINEIIKIITIRIIHYNINKLSRLDQRVKNTQTHYKYQFILQIM